MAGTSASALVFDGTSRVPRKRGFSSLAAAPLDPLEARVIALVAPQRREPQKKRSRVVESAFESASASSACHVGCHIGNSSPFSAPASAPATPSSGNELPEFSLPCAEQACPATSDTRADDARRDISDALPPENILDIISRLPPKQIASHVALVSLSWKKYACSQDLWRGLCTAAGLNESDARQCLGSWRCLYERVFGSNLVHCPAFEPAGSCAVSGGTEFVNSCPFSSGFKRVPDGVLTLDQHSAEQLHCGFSAWASDNASVLGLPGGHGTNTVLRTTVSGPFQEAAGVCRVTSSDREAEMAAAHADSACVNCNCSGLASREAVSAKACGIDAAQGVIDTGEPALESGAAAAAPAAPAPAAAAAVDPVTNNAGVSGITAGVDGTMLNEPEALDCSSRAGYTPGVPETGFPVPGSPAVTAVDYSWDCLRQHLSLMDFPGTFLDQRPPIELAVWCAALVPEAGGSGGQLKVQVQMHRKDGSVKHCWTSKIQFLKCNKWRKLSYTITGYPKGVRYITISVCGRRVHLTQVDARFLAKSS